MIQFVITSANYIKRESPLVRIQRETEYMYCLSRIFSYNLPVSLVISETNNEKYRPVEFFPYKKVVSVKSTRELGAVSKSKQEYVSLKEIILTMDAKDSDWIIKISGRYMLINDTFMEEVKNTSESVKAVIKTSKEGMHTFLFALRFGVFKKLFDEKEIDNTTYIEEFIYLYLVKSLKNDEIRKVDSLGVFHNIANMNKFGYS